MSKISPSRRAAFEVLHDIEVAGAMSSILADYDERLSSKDRGLSHEIVLGSLRRQIALDREINHFAGGKKLDIAIRVILRIGLYQLRYLDRVPAYSAINESVELARLAKRKSAAGFVNAILRRATRETPRFEYADELDRNSFETSHPRWLIDRWTDSFGPDRAASIAAANNDLPTQFFRPTPNATAKDIELISEYKDPRFDGVFSSPALNDDLLELLFRGAIYVQDAGSQLVATAVSKLIQRRFLDVCASPGGKTGLVAMLCPGREIVAGDITKNRVDILHDNLAAQGCSNVQIRQYNAEKNLPFEEESFDTVFVDAPCSGTGTIRHNPEIRYRATDEELVRHSNRQLAILRNASELVDVEGTLVYSTCSLEAAENESVIDRFMSEDERFAVRDVALPERSRTGRGYWRLWPDTDGCDGFFVACLKRVKK